MARVYAQAHSKESRRFGEPPEWKIVFQGRWERNLRLGGYYAGHSSLLDLRQALVDDKSRSSSRDSDCGLKMNLGYFNDLGPQSMFRSIRDIREVRHRFESGDDDSRDFSGERTPEHTSDLTARSLSGLNDRDRRDRASTDFTTKRNFGDSERPEYTADMYVIKCGDRLYPLVNLPLYIGETLFGGASDPNIFLTGKFGDRVKTLPLEMWKLVPCPGQKPSLMVKTTHGSWVRLLEPQDLYRNAVGDAFIIAYFLDFARRSPSATVPTVEDYLASACSMYGRGPFVPKLLNHIRLLRTFLEKDQVPKLSLVLRNLFPQIFQKDVDGLPCDKEVLRSVFGLYVEEEKEEIDDLIWSRGLSSCGRYHQEDFSKTSKKAAKRGADERFPIHENVKRSRTSKEKRQFIRKKTNTIGLDLVVRGSLNSGAGQKFSATKKTRLDDPPICTLCDDGGDLVICDGPCSRYFHAFPGSGAESFCATLGLAKKETKGSQWFCQNCKLKQHQCFACGDLGSTDSSLGQPEVYMCAVPSCKRHYHAHCVAELVNFPNWREKANSFRNGLERVICSRHKCDTCGCTDTTPGALVQCRRCPRAWHRECFTNYCISGEHRTTTIWKHEQNEFVYCKLHAIDPKTLTPRRDHVRFPEPTVSSKVKKMRIKLSDMSSAAVQRQVLPPKSLAAEIGLLNP